jgi:acetyltransferase-like isoleucine patch superfamily enzyme
MSRWIVKQETAHKQMLRRVANRLLHSLARICPGSYSLRPRLHRLRGVRIGRHVFIGDDVYLENEYPECVEIGDNCEIGLRSVIMAHLRGPGRVVIEPNVWVGPCCLIAGANGRVLTIGEGAVIGGGSIITADVPPHAFVKSPSHAQAAIASVPLASATYQEFVRGLRPMPRGDARERASSAKLDVVVDQNDNPIE